MNQLVEISRNLLATCLGVKETEELVIVTDEDKRPLAEALYAAGKLLGAETMLLVMQEREKSGQEPPQTIAEAMKQADVAVCITKYSLTHTQARKNAAANGTRVATMPGITEDMFTAGAISADYQEVKRLTETVTDILTKGKQVRIEKGGYTLEFSIETRNGVPSTGMYLEAGQSGNLPSGEAYIAPVEGSANGQILVDGSIGGIGKIDAPLLLTVKDGRLVDAKGPMAARLLSTLGDGDGRMLAEFGIGTNHKARIIGVVLEDEKAFGTIHVAFGSNATFGGTIQAGVHIDLIVNEPDVYIDGVPLQEKGRFLFAAQ
ncbi:leucyl aminopeptidase (aminopeptidase T) [Brevibacillus sp. CF112]|uniref:aminopeptidase n=1 Tax=Brevibacillus TaxID=55080 RepID=UPI000271C450|nr:aminopeptidase [Brevibacillus sp. CF112]EJL41995.1 leucyl aminopeptidase (aminopeptidase T) [Brevibacillus sp. CF112]